MACSSESYCSAGLTEVYSFLAPDPAQDTVKHRTLDQIRTSNFVIFPNFKWFGNKLVQNLVGWNKLARKILVLGFSWSERTSSEYFNL